MDELELLRSLRASGSTAPTATLDRARNALAERIAQDASPSPVRVRAGRTTPASRQSLTRRRVLWVAAAAAVAAGALVVGDVVSVDGSRPAATATAAEVLEASALAAIKTSDPVVGPTQYLKVDVKAVFDTSAVDPGGQTFVWLASQDNVQYIPGDRSKEWVWDRSAPREPIRFFGSDSEAYYKAHYATNGFYTGNAPGIGEPFWRAPGGAWFGSPQRILDMPLEEGLANLPREPEALLARIREYNKDKGQSRDGEVLVTVTTILSTYAVPADLRAALYRTLTLVPGITVVDSEATLDGRTGVAIGRVETAGGQQRREDIIIDQGTGQVIGRRTATLVDQGPVPAGTTTGWTAITTSVVDSAP